jgi:hypothetical protein
VIDISRFCTTRCFSRRVSISEKAIALLIAPISALFLYPSALGKERYFDLFPSKIATFLCCNIALRCNENATLGSVVCVTLRSMIRDYASICRSVSEVIERDWNSSVFYQRSLSHNYKVIRFSRLTRACVCFAYTDGAWKHILLCNDFVSRSAFDCQAGSLMISVYIEYENKRSSVIIYFVPPLHFSSVQLVLVYSRGFDGRI